MAKITKISTLGWAREQWLEERRKSLGGSDMGAVLGLNEPGCVLLSFAGLVLGGVLLVLSQKRGRNKKQIEFDIIRHI